MSACVQYTEGSTIYVVHAWPDNNTDLKAQTRCDCGALRWGDMSGFARAEDPAKVMLAAYGGDVDAARAALFHASPEQSRASVPAAATGDVTTINIDDCDTGESRMSVVRVPEGFSFQVQQHGEEDYRSTIVSPEDAARIVAHLAARRATESREAETRVVLTDEQIDNWPDGPQRRIMQAVRRTPESGLPPAPARSPAEAPSDETPEARKVIDAMIERLRYLGVTEAPFGHETRALLWQVYCAARAAASQRSGSPAEAPSQEEFENALFQLRYAVGDEARYQASKTYTGEVPPTPESISDAHLAVLALFDRAAASQRSGTNDGR